MKRTALSCILSLVISLAIAQPANDACGGAVTVPQTGCGTPTAGTTVGSGDHWVGLVGCQSGNNDEVWYTFVATGTQAVITVTSGTMGGNVEIILVLSSAPPCNGLSLAGSSCGPSPRTATFATTPGATYYYTVSSTGADGTFTTCITSSSPPPAAGFDCSTAAILCNDNTFSQGSSAAGFGTQEVSPANSCWGGGGERQSKWFKFSVGCTGTLEIAVDPVTNANDYDWAVWEITGDPAGCTTKGSSLACNWSACPWTTGMSSCANPCTSEGAADCGGPPGCQAAGISAAITVTAGRTYALLVDNFSVSNDGFTLRIGGACGGGTAIIGPDATFTGVITDAPSPCMALSCTKTCAIAPTTNSTYFWNFGDGYTTTTMNASHTYAVIGNYNVSLTVTDALGCSITTSQAFNIGCAPLPVELLRFTGIFEKENKRVLLNWETASERDNNHFEIERSVDGSNFISLGRITSKAPNGNSSQQLDYFFYDNSPVTGTAYYKLIQFDNSGRENYGGMIAVNVDEIEVVGVSLQPNPAHSLVAIGFNSSTDAPTHIRVVDYTGRIVKLLDVDAKEGMNTIEMPTDDLSKGIYLVQVISGTSIISNKLLKE